MTDNEPKNQNLSSSKPSRKAEIPDTIRNEIVRLHEYYGSREIARRVGWSRKIVRRVLNEQGCTQPPEPRSASKLDPFRNMIQEKVEKGLTGVADALNVDITVAGRLASIALSRSANWRMPRRDPEAPVARVAESLIHLPSLGTAMLTQLSPGVPSAQSRMWSIAADAAEAADEAPRALMISAPRCWTFGMKVSRYQS